MAAFSKESSGATVVKFMNLIGVLAIALNLDWI